VLEARSGNGPWPKGSEPTVAVFNVTNWQHRGEQKTPQKAESLSRSFHSHFKNLTGNDKTHSKSSFFAMPDLIGLKNKKPPKISSATAMSARHYQ